MKIELDKKYDFSISEPKWRNFWEQEGVYNFTFEKGKPTYVVDTPPPYVSASHLHIGHVMSFSQAEFLVRYYRMKGHNVFYTMGFDDNGLPTERFVEKKYEIDKSKITKKEFVELCLKETAEGAKNYKELWQQVGLSLDWSNTYSTINPTATKVSQWSLVDLYNKGHLYRKEMPMLWCTFCETALAQADLEDLEEKSFMNTIAFEAEDGTELLIATTRPELLPGCVALYTHPQDERYAHLHGKQAKVPMFDYMVPIKTSEAVDPEKGTGLMMVCTWGDAEDVEKWQLDGLDTRQVFTVDGKMNELSGKYEGHNMSEAREVILEDLKKDGLLKGQQEITHTKNCHERCGTAANFLASKQWFIKIADQKETWLAQGEKLNWYPAHYKNEYDIWVNGLKWDWCISRQRFYGVPMPIWYCDACDEPVFASEEQLPIEPSETTPPVDACIACGGTSFTPEKDVMDTWATSSCTPFLLKELIDSPEQKAEMFPVSLRPNAHEIIRTWDFYSVVKAYYNFGTIPFKDVMISGHGLDEQGRKVSKRLGNFKPSQELIEEFGADNIRYWATGASLGENLRFQPDEVAVGKKTGNKLWNVARLMAMHAEHYNPEQDYSSSYEHADAWILSQLNETISVSTSYLEKYEFAKARNVLSDFFWSKFTDRYIEFIKYRLWNEDLEVKHVALDVMFKVFFVMLQMYGLIMPFITEELYQAMYRGHMNTVSLHITAWPESTSLPDLDSSDFDHAIIAIDEIRKYKSDNQLSLGAELEQYELQTKVDIEKYGSFISQVMRVRALS